MSGAGETLPVGAAAEEPTSGEGKTAPTGGAEEVMSAVAATGTEEELGASTKTNPNFDASRKSKLWKYCYRKGLIVESLFHKSLMESGDKMPTKAGRLMSFSVTITHISHRKEKLRLVTTLNARINNWEGVRTCVHQKEQRI